VSDGTIRSGRLNSPYHLLTFRQKRNMMLWMRTTIHIDDEILEELKREANRAGTPINETVNRILRLGLERLHPAKRTAVSLPDLFHGLPPIFKSG
jgi:hypothetical protein